MLYPYNKLNSSTTARSAYYHLRFPRSPMDYFANQDCSKEKKDADNAIYKFFTSVDCQAELVEAGITILTRLRQAQADSF
jgi:hypothetical protein